MSDLETDFPAFTTLPVNEIIIKKRIRQNKGNLSDLKVSIQKFGLLNPIIVDRNYRLIAGERRLAAIKELGLEKIDVKIVDASSKYFKISLEIDENQHRKDFTLKEMERGLALQKKLRLKEEKNFFSYYWTLLVDWVKSLYHKWVK